MRFFSLVWRRQARQPLRFTPHATGRRRRTDIPYVFPKDSKEIDRLDFQHFVLRSLLKGNYRVPLRVEQVHSILDVGCGTGRWCREMAEAFPSARVIGTDVESQLNPLVPLPPNFQFVQNNVLHGLPFADGSMEYVHQRLLIGAIPASMWPVVLRELVRVTRSPGWVELVEGTDLYQNSGPAMQQMLAWGKQASTKHGIDASIVPKLAPMLEIAGLREVKAQMIEAPLGSWAGRQGHLLALDMQYIFESLKDFYCQSLALECAVFDATLAALPQEWEHFKTVYTFYIVYGKR